MAVLSINKNGIISLENYNDYSQEGALKAAVGAVGVLIAGVVLIPITIVLGVIGLIVKIVTIIINLFKKIIDKIKDLFRYKMSPETIALMKEFCKIIDSDMSLDTEDESLVVNKIREFFKNKNQNLPDYYDKAIIPIAKARIELGKFYKSAWWIENKTSDNNFLYKYFDKLSQELDKMKNSTDRTPEQEFIVNFSIKVTNESIAIAKECGNLGTYLVEFEGNYDSYYRDVREVLKQMMKSYKGFNILSKSYLVSAKKGVQVPKTLLDVLKKINESYTAINQYNSSMFKFVTSCNVMFTTMDKMNKRKNNEANDNVQQNQEPIVENEQVPKTET